MKLGFFVLLSNLAFAAEPICANWINPIAQDMQITESQLTDSASENAKNYLSKNSNLDQNNFSVLNSKKVVIGYSLKTAAENGNAESVKAFCTWLTKEGFWHD